MHCTDPLCKFSCISFIQTFIISCKQHNFIIFSLTKMNNVCTYEKAPIFNVNFLDETLKRIPTTLVTFCQDMLCQVCRLHCVLLWFQAVRVRECHFICSVWTDIPQVLDHTPVFANWFIFRLYVPLEQQEYQFVLLYYYKRGLVQNSYKGLSRETNRTVFRVDTLQ